ncbi:uncharacterized protein LOC128951733 [Oppia nitens]|uniref:uncharacterized protein LOC128951733 n=1 Tax=Oppia nitens TaxID=1686743 RepID=UPI0023D9A1B1|nr:uncharacterized protein LOC128951733 [Oppia nitens]
MVSNSKFRQQKPAKNVWKLLYNKLFREILVPLFLMITTPNLTILLSYIILKQNKPLTEALIYDFPTTIQNAWLTVHWFDLQCWTAIGLLLGWGLISLHLPAKPYNGPITSNGFTPKYWHTGFRFYLISMAITVPLLYIYRVSHLFDKLYDFTGNLIVFGFIVCLFLYIKGLLWPSKGLHNRTGNPIFDYYWGIELYPHLSARISLKILIICRFGLILWQYIVLLCWKSNYESLANGQFNYALTASTILQSIYLAKFFYWEDGYMNTIDTSVDRFGYMVCWGCIAYVPGFYPITSLYLSVQPLNPNYTFQVFLLNLLCGIAVIGLNYWSDQQKLVFRATNGKCIIWGKPAKLIRAEYEDDFGKVRKSILLTSGFWGLTRHINYTFELMSTFLWCIPSLFNSPVPYLYLLFLTVLLIHRSVRDDNKCAKKYGKYWQQYKGVVKYQMIPYVY